MEHLSHKRKLTIMMAIMAAMFFASINQTIIGVAMPRIISKLGGMDYYTWIMTIYLLTSTIATIIVGKLSDIYGRKPFILIGILFFMVGAFLCGTSKDMIQLIAYRGIQGIGAGIIMATAFTAVGDLFSPRERGRWAGFMSAVFGISSILGPGLGGYIVDHMDWHWVFWIFLPLGVIAFFMILFLFPSVPRREAEKIDYLGSLFLTLTIVPLLLAFSWAGTKYPWSSVYILGLFLLSLIALSLLIVIEMRVQTPVLPLSLFKNRIISISNIIGFIMNAVMMGALMYMPFFVQGSMGVSATYAGYVTMPMSLSMFATSAIIGQHITKTGKYKMKALLGLAIMVAGMFIMAFMDTIPIAVISMITFGMGLGMGMPVFTLIIQNAADSRDLGVATASMQLFRSLGGTIGIAVMGTIMSTTIATKMKSYTSMGNLPNMTQSDPAVATKMSELLNPQILLDPSRLAAIQSSLPSELQTIAGQMVSYLREALTSSLSNVFLTGAFLLVIALILTLFIQEIPLRTTVKSPGSIERSEKPTRANPLTSK